MKNKDIKQLNSEEKKQLLKKLLEEKNIHQSFHYLFKKQVKDHPDSIAVEMDKQYLTYTQLSCLVDRCAHQLFKKEDIYSTVFLIGLAPSLYAVISLVTMFMYKCTFMPLDLDYPNLYIERCLEKINQKKIVLLTLEEKRGKFSDNNIERIVTLDYLCGRNFDMQLRDSGLSPETDKNQIPSETSICLFPRDEQLSLIQHKTIMQRINWLQTNFKITHNDIVLCTSPLIREESFREILWPLTYGARIIINTGLQPDAAGIAKLIESKGISITGLTTDCLKILNQYQEEGKKSRQLDSLRLIFHRGDSKNTAFTGKAIVDYYSCPWTGGEYIYSLKEKKSQSSRAIYQIAYNPLFVLNDTMRVVPLGCKGQLYCAIDGNFINSLKIYYKGSDDYIENPLKKGQLLYPTGLKVRISHDKKIEVLEFLPNSVNKNGFQFNGNIISSYFLENFEIKECIPFYKQDINHQDKLLVFVLGGKNQLYKRIRSRIIKNLPSYMVPDHIIPITTVPLTDRGTINYEILAQIPPIDETYQSYIHKQLKNKSEIDEVYITTEKISPCRRVLHLSDIVPEYKLNRSMKNIQSGSSTTQSQMQENRQESFKPAICSNNAIDDFINQPQTLTQAFMKAAQEPADKGILYIDEKDRVFESYADLNIRARKILKSLQGLGLRKGNTVLFQFTSNRDFVQMFWACTLGGIIPVPLSLAQSYQNKNNDTEKLYRIWKLLEEPSIFTDHSNIKDLSSMHELYAAPDMQFYTIDSLRDNSESDNIYESQPDDVAIILFTSGSTGIPKGVVQCHKSLAYRSLGTIALNNFHSGDISLNWMPLDHVGGIVMFHVRDIFSCCSQLQVDKQYILKDPLRWMDLVSEHQVTVTWAPNFAYNLINNYENEIPKKKWNLDSLRFILNGGEAVRAKTGLKFLKLLSQFNLPSTAMFPAYGMSETSSGITYSHEFNHHTINEDDQFVSVGQPIPGISLRIVNQQNKVLKEGEIGNLQVKGTTITREYYKNPELTRESFTEDHWFVTGDLAFIRDGKLTITGRTKELIIINGINYFCQEIESVVDDLEGIEPTFTAATSIHPPGEDTDLLVIFYVSTYPDINKKAQQINEIKAKILEKVGISPEVVIPVTKDDIPKTAIGKVERNKLGEMFLKKHFDPLLKEIDLALENRNTIPNWFGTPAWFKKSIGHYKQPAKDEVFLIFSDQTGMGSKLRKWLDQQKIQWICIEIGPAFVQQNFRNYQIDPSRFDQYEKLFTSLNDENITISSIIHAWAYDKYENPITQTIELEQSQYMGCFSIFFMIKAFVNHSDQKNPLKLYTVTSHCNYFENDKKIDIEKATIPGLLKTISLENPWIKCRHIDLEYTKTGEGIDFLINELWCLSSETDIMYRKNVRYIKGLSEVDFSKKTQKKFPIKKQGVYLVTGGLGGIGKIICQYLLSRYSVKLIIIGKTVLPDREDWLDYVENGSLLGERVSNYLKLEKSGGDIVYHNVDLANFDMLKQVVNSTLQAWDLSLSGILHLAGEGNLKDHWQNIDNRVLKGEVLETFTRNFNPKVYGTQNLVRLIDSYCNKNIQFFTFSSVDSFFGSISYGPYSAANSFLDIYCNFLKSHKFSETICINWTMWKNIGMSKGDFAYIEDSVKRSGYHIISEEQGLYSFLVALSFQLPQIFVGLDNTNENIQIKSYSGDCCRQELKLYYSSKRKDFVLNRQYIPDLFGNPFKGKLIKVPQFFYNDKGDLDLERLKESSNEKIVTSQDRKEPKTDTEIALADIFKAVLNTRNIAVDDNFFDLGGNSLLATQLVSRIKDVFMIDFSLKSLFKKPDISGIVETFKQIEKKSGQIEAVARIRRKISKMSDDEINQQINKKR